MLVIYHDIINENIKLLFNLFTFITLYFILRITGTIVHHHIPSDHHIVYCDWKIVVNGQQIAYRSIGHKKYNW